MKHGINVKSQKSKVKSIDTTQYLKILVVFLMFIFLTINIYFSQFVSPIYFGLINGKQEFVVSFLKKIRTLNFFENEYDKYREVYGNNIYYEIFSEENDRNQKIKEFEQILSKNPKSRDALYSLFLLYKKKGEEITANGYLRQAKAIDPNIR